MRGAGLCAFDLLTPLKQSVIRAAMGLEGELPALAKGEKSNNTRLFSQEN